MREIYLHIVIIQIACVLYLDVILVHIQNVTTSYGWLLYVVCYILQVVFSQTVEGIRSK